MHQIFSQVYSAVPIWPSYMESCTEFSQGPLSTLELSRDPPKDKQDFNRFCHTSFFGFRKKFLFLETGPLFSHNRRSPQMCILIRPWWFFLNRIWASTAWFIKNFFWWSPHFSHLNLPITITEKSIWNFNWSWKTYLHVLFHFMKNPYFWWPPHFCHVKMSLQESRKGKDN